MAKVRIATTHSDDSLGSLIVQALRHPRSLRVIGPDTGLFVWQIARKLHWWWLADKVREKLSRMGFKPAYRKLAITPLVTLHWYEIHNSKLIKEPTQ